MTNKELFKDVNKKKRSKKTVDGYYGDKTGFYTLYKDEDGNMTTKRKKGKK